MRSTDPSEERRHLDAVERDLVTEFAATLTAGEVARRFAEVVHAFDGAPIRDFVPVLARKQARQEMRDAAV